MALNLIFSLQKPLTFWETIKLSNVNDHLGSVDKATLALLSTTLAIEEDLLKSLNTGNGMTKRISNGS